MQFNSKNGLLIAGLSSIELLDLLHYVKRYYPEAEVRDGLLHADGEHFTTIKGISVHIRDEKRSRRL